MNPCRIEYVLAVPLVAAAFLGCSSPPPEPLPAGATPLEVMFGDGVRLEGFEAPKEPIRPGTPVSITLFFRAGGPITGDPLRQLYLTGDCEGLNLSGRDDALLDAQSRPPSRWPPGALVRDTVRIETPGRIATGEVGVWLGLAMGGNQRYKVIGTAEADLNDRLFLTTLPVAGRTPSAPPALEVPRLTGAPPAPMVLDGKADEPAWGRAVITAPFAGPGGAAAPQETTARLVALERALYIVIEGADSDIFSPYLERDDPVTMQDAVGVLLQTDGSRPGYYEVSISPGNRVQDIHHPRCRQRPGPEWTSPVRSGVVLRGAVSEERSGDRGYTVEIEIPFGVEGAPDGGAPGGRTPGIGSPGAGSPGVPDPGARWRLNLLRYDSVSPYQQAGILSAWSPLEASDPHAPGRFGTLTFRNVSW